MGSLISLLQQRAYRRLWVARTVSQWGDAFNTVALVLLVYSRTGSGVGVSGVVVAEIVPVLLLAPLAGAVVDRISRVRVMVAADLSRAALVFALPFFDGQLSAVYATAFALAAGAVFFNPAAQSVLPSIVRERDLVAANSGLWSAAVVSQIVLAPLAGIVVATYGYAWAFWLNAASYLVSAVALRRLHLRAPPASTTSASWYLDARAGIAVLARHQLLRALAAAQLLAALSAGATSALLVVLSAEQLDLTAGDYGLLLGAIGVGAAAGPLALSKLTDDPRRPAYVLGPFAVRAVVDATLATVTGLAPALVALVAYGVGTSTGAVTFAPFSRQRRLTGCAGGFSPGSTCCGSSAGCCPCWLVVCWRTRSASALSSISVPCSSSPPLASAGQDCARSRPPGAMVEAFADGRPDPTATRLHRPNE